MKLAIRCDISWNAGLAYLPLSTHTSQLSFGHPVKDSLVLITSQKQIQCLLKNRPCHHLTKKQHSRRLKLHRPSGTQSKCTNLLDILGSASNDAQLETLERLALPIQRTLSGGTVIYSSKDRTRWWTFWPRNGKRRTDIGWERNYLPFRIIRFVLLSLLRMRKPIQCESLCFHFTLEYYRISWHIRSTLNIRSTHL